MPAADHQVDYVLSVAAQSYIDSVFPAYNASGEDFISFGYFGKTTHDLNLAECAMLA